MLNVTYHQYHYKRCANGHMIYGSSPVATEYCSICGASFVSKCPECSYALPSTFQSPAYFGSGKPVHPPARPGACSNCGKSFPWTLRQAANAELTDIEAVGEVVRICARFHDVVRQLRLRHDNRQPFDIADEYDVQDLIHALLRTRFEDIRPEEWTPSYAGGAARADFLIRPYMILLEIKKTRPRLTTKDVGSQLIEDIARYKQIAGLKTLVVFIYDPEERIHNPKGFIADIEKTDKSIDLRVVISPQR